MMVTKSDYNRTKVKINFVATERMDYAYMSKHTKYIYNIEIGNNIIKIFKRYS
jgi:hypothetical protein